MTEKEAKRFIRACARQLGLGFHPDNRFTEYVNTRYERSFTDKAAQRHDNRMWQAHNILGNSIYEVAIEEWKKQGWWHPEAFPPL